MVGLLSGSKQSDRCYRNTDNSFSFFSTKTAYSLVSAKQNYIPPNCKALQLWLLSRHGTRHPKAVVIDKISQLVRYKNKITNKSSLCEEDVKAINTWNFKLTEADGNKLNSQGADDLSSLGRRLGYLYKDIFNEPYNADNFKVISSPKSRCVESASYFLKSAFNMNVVTDVPLMNEDDIRLNISQLKKINNKDVMKKTAVNDEIKKFRYTVHMEQLVFRVSVAMGLDHNLTLDTVKIMYESCRYEKAWHINSHPAWCAVFSRQDLEILEYEEDLKYYYSNGYGDPFNERTGCPIIKDLVKNFKRKSRTRLGPKAVLYFSHSSNVLSAIVGLGFARDATPLSSTNFNDSLDRKWKTSYLCPFASNVMAVLYDCNAVTKVTFFVNEIPMVIQEHGCTLCPWDLIEKKFDPIVSGPSCTFGRPSSSVVVIVFQAIVATTVVVLYCTLLYFTAH